MQNDSNYLGEWKDVLCYTKANFACTMDASPSLNLQPAFQQVCSESGYISYHDSCFGYDATPRTFNEATQFCESGGHTIATIRDNYEVALAMAMLYFHGSSETWIGLRKDKETYAFGWSDSWPFIYTNWRAGKPSGPNTDGYGCAAIDANGYWFDTSCSEKRPTICKNTKASPPTTQQPYVTGFCPSGFIAWGSHCYFFVSKEKVISDKIIDPSYYCLSRRWYPVSVHSKAENTFLTTQAKALLGGDSILIGLWRTKAGYLRWDSSYNSEMENPSKLVDFVNWHTDGTVHDEEDHCVGLMPSKDGTWRFINCSDTLGFVCKRSQTSPEPTEIPTSGLSGGEIVAVVIGTILVINIVLGLGYFFWRNHRATKPDSPDLPPPSTTGFDNVLYTPSVHGTGDTGAATSDA